MSLYADYIKEYDGFDIVEIPDVGFATYKCAGEECYIKDIYIRPDHRSQKISFQIQESIITEAKAKGCKYLLGTVDHHSKSASYSMAGLLKDGFKYLKTDSQFMYFTKRIV